MYKLTDDPNFVVDLTDNASLPVAGTWRSEIYQKWLAAGNTPQPAQTLDDIKLAQIATLSSACRSQIYAGFASSALGAPYHYPMQDKDQANLNASVVDALRVQINAVSWLAGAAVVAGKVVEVNGEYLQAAIAGTTGSTAPSVPAIGATVADGGVTWKVWTTDFWCADSAGVWALRPHTAAQIQQVGSDAKSVIMAAIKQNDSLAAQVNSASTVAAVQAIVWVNP